MCGSRTSRARCRCASRRAACCRPRSIRSAAADSRSARRRPTVVRTFDLLLPGSPAAWSGRERRGRMSYSHASTRLVHDVQFPLSHTDRGERKRVRRWPGMCGNRRADAASAAASHRPVPASRQAPQAPRYRRAGCAGRAQPPSHPLCDAALASSAASNPPSGPMTIAQGAARAASSRPARAWAIGGPPPVSSHTSSRRPAGQSPSSRAELHRRAHLGHAQPLGLLGRLDGIGAQALDVDALDDGVVRDDRLQDGDAELGGLLGDIVDARALEGREAEPDVGLGRPARACARRCARPPPSCRGSPACRAIRRRGR